MTKVRRAKLLRIMAGLTVLQAAALLGIHHNSLYHIEAGERNMSVPLLQKYAKLLRASMEEVLEFMEDP